MCTGSLAEESPRVEERDLGHTHKPSCLAGRDSSYCRLLVAVYADVRATREAQATVRSKALPGAVKPWAWELDCARGTGRRCLAQDLVSGARCPTARCPDGASLRCPRSLPNTELLPRLPCGRSPRHRSAHRLAVVAETCTTRPLAASATAPNEPQHQPAGGPHVRDRSLPLRRQRGPGALRPRPYTRYWCRGGHGASPGDGSAWSRISRSPRLARSLHENQAVRG
jgi:hypothetical protein